MLAHGFAHRVNALRIDHLKLLGQVGFRRQRQHQVLEGGIQRGLLQHLAHGADIGIIQHASPRNICVTSYECDSAIDGQALPGFPAVEGVAVVREQVQQLGIGVVEFKHHGRGEVAQDRGHGLGVDVHKGECRAGLREHQGARSRGCVGVRGQLQRQVPAIGPQQSQVDRNDKRFLDRLARRWRAALRQRQGVAACGGVVDAMRLQPRCAGLAVPALELRQHACQTGPGVGVRDGLRKVVAGHGLAVMALEVQCQAFGKAVAAHERLHHPDHLGAFFVNGDGVEVVDLDVAVGPHRVSHRACVFRELRGAQHAHVFDALDGARRGFSAQVLRKFLVTKDRQAFLQAELEPVAAGHAVAGPVVKILMAHHTFYIREVGIGGGGLVGQHVLGVEDVQALVFHRAHVEVAGGHNHEALQIQRQAEARFVPGHGVHQRSHGVPGFFKVAGAHIDLEQMRLARARGDALLPANQLAGHQRKQVAGFFVRVHPAREVAAIVQIALRHQVAVGQQHRVLCLVGAQRNGVTGHHVRAIQKVGDAPKALGLALREEGVVADIQAHQLGVFGRTGGGENFQLEGRVAFGQVFQHQLFALHLERGALAVDQHARQVEIFTVELQGLRRHVGVAAQRHFVEHARLQGVQVKTQIDAVNPVGGRTVVGAVDAHCGALS